jgi:hypothetical protein
MGFESSAPHPVDVLIGRNVTDWLVEVKVVYDFNYVEAFWGNN